MTYEYAVEDLLMHVQLYIKSKVFHFVLQSIYCFHFYCKRHLNLYFYPYDSLKLKNDTDYLMKSEDTFEDPLMSVQFYIKSEVSSIRDTGHLLFSFSLQETLKSVLLPPYEYLKLKKK